MCIRDSSSNKSSCRILSLHKDNPSISLPTAACPISYAYGIIFSWTKASPPLSVSIFFLSGSQQKPIPLVPELTSSTLSFLVS